MAALFEKPLHELRTYMGTNPRPADFDEYWERALDEMEKTDSQITLVPSAFQTDFAQCFDLYFTGVKNTRIHAKYLRPSKIKEKCPAIFQFHGYSGNSGDWQSKLNYVARGFCVAALDCRGQAGLSDDRGSVKGTTYRGQIIRGLSDDDPDNLLFRQIFLDTAQLARIVMGFDEVDENRTGAMGGSQGGGLTIACAALEPRIRRLAPVYPFLSDYKRVWDMDLAKDAYEELKTYFRNFDPRHEREEEIFTKLGYIDIQHLAPRIEGEVLMGTGLQDTVCPPSTQFAAYNRIRSKKEVVIYPDFGHEGLPDFLDMTYEFLSKI